MSDLVVKELDDRLKLIKNTVAKDLSNDEFLLFANIAKSRGLDIMLGQMHAIKRRQKDGPAKVTYTISIDGLRALAARTKEYAGSDEPKLEFDDDKKLVKATVTVYRIIQGQKCAFTATAYWNEYYPGEKMGFMWDRLPTTMLSKVAEAQALRKGFSSDLTGLYAEEEMHQGMRDVNTVNERTLKLTEKFNAQEKPEAPVYNDGKQDE